MKVGSLHTRNLGGSIQGQLKSGRESPALLANVERAMTEQALWMSVWNGVIVLTSVYYLSGSFTKSLLIATFVLGSCLVGFGRRWVMRGGFALAVFAIAVALGMPHPERWIELVHSAPDAIEAARSILSSLARI
jgi:hypothetical protein